MSLTYLNQEDIILTYYNISVEGILTVTNIHFKAHIGVNILFGTINIVISQDLIPAINKSLETLPKIHSMHAFNHSNITITIMSLYQNVT